MNISNVGLSGFFILTTAFHQQSNAVLLSEFVYVMFEVILAIMWHILNKTEISICIKIVSEGRTLYHPSSHIGI